MLAVGVCVRVFVCDECVAELASLLVGIIPVLDLGRRALKVSFWRCAAIAGVVVVVVRMLLYFGCGVFCVASPWCGSG